MGHNPVVDDRERLRLLLEISNALVGSRDLHALFRNISDRIRPVIRHDYSSLCLYDPAVDRFQIYALDFPESSGVIHEEETFPAEGTPAGSALQSRMPLLVKNLGSDQFHSPVTKHLLREGIKSLCLLPLVHGDRPLGVLNISSFRENAFVESELEFLAQVANQVAIAVENALAFREISELKDKLFRDKRYLEDEIRAESGYDEMVGQSPAWRHVLQQISQVAQTGATVLILGETGTGKELIARSIHEQSRRREHSFVKTSCATVPTGLLESELFGHEKGAFTGAIVQQIGRFELAHTGTLFLDELGDIPLELQPKLLRVLQEQEFERLGSTRVRKVDVRVIAATNRNLQRMVAAGEFREDLYYRLKVFPILAPPLRERAEDIPLLVRYFLQKHAVRMGKKVDSVSEETMQALIRWHWPGNVRELGNLIERSVILSPGRTLQVPLAELTASEEIKADESQPNSLLDTERDHIVSILKQCNWVVGGPKGAATRLGLKRTTLSSMMKRLGLTVPKPETFYQHK